MLSVHIHHFHFCADSVSEAIKVFSKSSEQVIFVNMSATDEGCVDSVCMQSAPTVEFIFCTMCVWLWAGIL